MAHNFERSWHYILLIRSGKTPAEAQKIVIDNIRRVAKETAITNHIFETEKNQEILRSVGLRTINPKLN